jgi:hypothetical protein
VQPRGSGEPDLWVALAGAGVKLTIQGTSATDRDGRFVTRLAGLPDMPLSSFTMRLGAPGDGLLSLDANPCAGKRARRLEVEAILTGQNGARRNSSLAIATGGSRCGSGGAR